jgi:hypothetical protein
MTRPDLAPALAGLLLAAVLAVAVPLVCAGIRAVGEMWRG